MTAKAAQKISLPLLNFSFPGLRCMVGRAFSCRGFNDYYRPPYRPEQRALD